MACFNMACYAQQCQYSEQQNVTNNHINLIIQYIIVVKHRIAKNSTNSCSIAFKYMKHVRQSTAHSGIQTQCAK